MQRSREDLLRAYHGMRPTPASERIADLHEETLGAHGILGGGPPLACGAALAGSSSWCPTPAAKLIRRPPRAGTPRHDA